MKSIEHLVRENIKSLEPYSSARSLHLSGILLDANENPYDLFGQPGQPALNRYPNGSNPELKDKIAEQFSAASKQITVGNGSDEIIDLMIRIFCEPRVDRICVCVPTYSMYRVAANIQDVDVLEVPLKDYDLDEAAVQLACLSPTKILFLCNPNNPTSTLYSREKVLRLLDTLNCIVVVDEAYMDFAGEASLIGVLDTYKNLVVMRTFSKAYAMAGVRLGFAFASEEITALLHKVKMPYNINVLTTQAVLEGLDHAARIGPVITELVERRELLEQKLRDFDFVEEILPSHTNFLCVKFTNAEDVFKKMLARHIVLRKLSGPYLAGYLRISVGTEAENRLLLDALTETMGVSTVNSRANA